MGEHKLNSPESLAMKDAHTRCAQLENYSGSIVILFTRDFQNVQLGSTLPADRAPAILRALLAQLDPPASIILPPH